MKILHTSDWHLGKRLYGRSRLGEQKKILDEITEIARREGVDAMLIAGDIFDTFVPPAEAEQLFYESVTAIAKVCLPVIISGNHDDEQRLLAPDRMALAAGVVFAGSGLNATAVTPTGLTVQTGERLIRVKKGNETLNIAFLSYPTAGKLLDAAGELSFTDYIREQRERACEGFTEDGYNIFVSHLFVTGSESDITDERELGGSKLVPKAVLTQSPCDYTALGHIHKPVTVSRSHAVYYSGSIAQYSFDDDSVKRVIIAEFNGKSREIKSVPLTSYTPLITIYAESEEEIERKIAEVDNGLVLIKYRSAQPLSPSFTSRLRKNERFCHIEAERVIEQRTAAERRGKTDRELFEMFYERKKNEKPSEEIISLFLDAVNGEVD